MFYATDGSNHIYTSTRVGRPVVWETPHIETTQF
jgi:hypothetical protein